jgi:hypothetical protein
VDYHTSSIENNTLDGPSYDSGTNNHRSNDSCSSLEFEGLGSASTDAVENNESSRHSLILAMSSTSNNGDLLPKTFLQLKGISVANYNMGCNFSIVATLWLMRNRELSAIEMASIKRTCDKWGFLFKMSKLQILIIDKLLATCHHETNIYEDGWIIKSQFEVSRGRFLNFIPIYGIPHSSGNYVQ